jgi:hypothetical protein
MYDKKMIYFSGREALIVHFLGGRSNLVMRGNCTRLYLSRDFEKLTTPTRQCT